MPAQLHVEESGQGAPLVAIHGFGASAYTWRKVLGDLAASHHVYAVDLKGSGQSPKPRDGHYSMRDQAALVLEMIAERGLTGLTLVGHSFGGGVALIAAIELLRSRPGTLTSLVLFASPAYRQRMPLFIGGLQLPLFGPLVQWLTPVSFQVRTVLQLAYHDDTRITGEQVAAYAAPLGMPGGRQALRATARQIVPSDIDTLVTQYASITVPTLLIWGRHDQIVPLEVGQRLHRAIPGSRLLVIDEAGHVPHEEIPERVSPALRGFLG